MPYYISAEHKFEIGERVKWNDNQIVIVLTAMFVKSHPGFVNLSIGYDIRTSTGTILAVREIELEPLEVKTEPLTEESNIRDNDDDIPF